MKINKSIACDWNSEALSMLVEALVLFLDLVSISMSHPWILQDLPLQCFKVQSEFPVLSFKTQAMASNSDA